MPAGVMMYYTVFTCALFSSEECCISNRIFLDVPISMDRGEVSLIHLLYILYIG
jgi:hypothetical protein